MTSNAVMAIGCIFRESWRLFTSWHIPGTNISPAAWLVFAVVFFIGLKMVFGILGMTGVFSSYSFTKSGGDMNELRRFVRANDAIYSKERSYDRDFADAMAYRQMRNQFRM